ncbi:hypothetical protein Ga0074812_1526 [Parafrankia irregularis]|uniref:Nucleotidyl transferase AbiEii toxin, Type IV TA system n=1 Tax=Parafrankia irregularis TaxID=795642 RepID=A0A0S4QZI6_9ACTN|nr:MULTISPECIES: hypothetical protein [Parafrankia]MBE3206717.1 hypothetical protein [Parafrankia sp. CH37]CUU60981.1 hypothetical protein Ga0074812_1526 [Parafrankia irregularis]
MRRFELRGLLRRLADHHVNYVIVGGVGARLQGAPNITDDLDVVPEPTPENLSRLAAALSGPATTKKAVDSTEYVAHPVVEPAEFYEDYMAMYITSAGALDVLIELPGVGPYDALMREARSYELPDHGLTIHVASLEHIIRSKETAGRSKDFLVLPSLYEAATHLAEQGDSYELDGAALRVDGPPAGSDEDR